MTAYVSILLILALNVFQQIHGFNPKQNPVNSWVYFGRGLNQREIIDLARPTGEELPLSPSSPSSTAKITTEKLLETTLESRVTADGPSTTTVIPTTAAPVATKEIPNIRNLPETIEVNETTTSTSTSTSESVEATTVESMEKEVKLVTDLPKEIVVEASTSESPLRAKIVVIPKEKIIVAATTDASEIFENVTDSIQASSTKETEILEVAASTSFAVSSKKEESTISPAKKSSKEESSASSEEEKEKTAAVASIPSLRVVLRRIFKGE